MNQHWKTHSLSRNELLESSVAISRGLRDAIEGRATPLEDFDTRMRALISDLRKTRDEKPRP